MRKYICIVFIFLFTFTVSAFAVDMYSDVGLDIVKVETSKGDIYLRLFKEKSPVSVKNFLTYVEKGFYDKTIFHRVIDGFMIQGGGFEDGMIQKAVSAPIKNEAKNGLLNFRGTVSMARTNNPNSATSQFFINVVDNSFLNYRNSSNYGYAVFAEVIGGMDVVDKIKNVSTGVVSRFKDVPLDPVYISKASRIRLYEKL